MYEYASIMFVLLLHLYDKCFPFSASSSFSSLIHLNVSPFSIHSRIIFPQIKTTLRVFSEPKFWNIANPVPSPFCERWLILSVSRQIGLPSTLFCFWKGSSPLAITPLLFKNSKAVSEFAAYTDFCTQAIRVNAIPRAPQPVTAVPTLTLIVPA